MMRPYCTATLFHFIALVVVDYASSFHLLGGRVVVLHQQKTGTNQESNSRQANAAYQEDINVTGVGVTKTTLFFNTMPGEDTSSKDNDGTSSGGPTKIAMEFSSPVDEESLNESPQEKIWRLRSGKLTSYEKRAFLQSTLQGSRRIRRPVARRSTRDNSTSVLNAEKSARAVRQNYAYVSRVLNPSRSGLEHLVRERTAQDDDLNAAMPAIKGPDEVRNDRSVKPKLLKKYFSTSVSPSRQLATIRPRRTEDTSDEEIDKLIASDSIEVNRASDDVGKDPIESNLSSLITNVDNVGMQCQDIQPINLLEANSNDTPI